MKKTILYILVGIVVLCSVSAVFFDRHNSSIERTCSSGVCISQCSPNCNNKECGDNGCGGSCGSCSTGRTCSSGVCVSTCTSSCQSLGYQCGSQWICGSYLNCGTCSSGQTCSNGICTTACTSHYEKRCYSDDVYWYNSCGNREGREENCDSDERCHDGECERDCKNKDEKECYNGDVWWYDSCGDRYRKYDDCGDTEKCYDGECVPRERCGNYICEAGETCNSCAQDCGSCSILYTSKHKVPVKTTKENEITVDIFRLPQNTGMVVATNPSVKDEGIFLGPMETILIGTVICLFIALLILLMVFIKR